MWVYTRYISTFSRRIKKVGEEIISKLLKDTADPLSHHVMASPNIFNRTQALAPAQKITNIRLKLNTFGLYMLL